jgi:hypothetical protein
LKIRSPSTLPALAVALAAAASCTSRPETQRDDPRLALAAAAGHLERGETREAIESSNAGLAKAREREGGEALQRFAAAFVAARAHARSFAAATDELSDMVALTMYADLAREVASEARAAEADSGKTLPVGLAGLDVDRALEYLDLAELAVHARLGFRTSVARVLERESRPPDPDELHERMERADLDPDLVPAVELALFRYLRNKDQALAYRYGALALDRSAARSDVLDPRERSEIEGWIERGSELEFHCPKCDLAVVAKLRACPNDQTPNAEFVSRRRETGTE